MNNFSVFIEEDQNSQFKNTMEDKRVERYIDKDKSIMFCGVLDGHGGPQAAEFCSQQIPKIFRELYDQYEFKPEELFTNLFQKVNDKLQDEDSIQ